MEKKYILQSMFLCSTTMSILVENAEANNEYIICSAPISKRTTIYDIVTRYRVPTILSKFVQNDFKESYKHLDVDNTFASKENEFQFLYKEMKKINKDIELLAIPKSLYQFIIYDYLVNNVRPYKFMKYFSPEDYITNEDWAITKACGYVMCQREVKNFFWQINKYACDLLKSNDYNIETLTQYVINSFKGRNKMLDRECKIKRNSPILDLTGIDYYGNPIKGWTEIKRSNQVKKITNYIISESKKDKYVICRAGKKYLDPDIASRLTVCYSDGLGSGLPYDDGASALVLSGNAKLWYLELDRIKLLHGLYPIFIPPAQHMLSACGSGEIFHVRSKVIQGVVTGYDLNKIDQSELGIRHKKKVPVCGYHLNQTPEYFTTTTPQILSLTFGKDNRCTYTITNTGILDINGLNDINNLCYNTNLMPPSYIF